MPLQRPAFREPVILPPRTGLPGAPLLSRPAGCGCGGKCGDCKSSPVVTVSIVITCGPGYARWVLEAVDSAIRQGATEILVVFDACEPVSLPATVRGIVVGHRNVHRARREGARQAKGAMVLFLDADDLFPVGFVKKAAAQLANATQRDSRVVGVYPAATYTHMDTGQLCGGSHEPPEWDAGGFERLNYMVVSTVVWRRPLLGSWVGEATHQVLEDHAMWMQLVRDGWVFQKGQDLVLQVRVHADSLSRAIAATPYAAAMGTACRPVTVFVALSGRGYVWDRLRDWLLQLPDNARLVLCLDTQDSEFVERVRRTDWGLLDVRCYSSGLGGASVADEDRRDPTVSRAVEERVCRLYNRAIQECGTEYMLFVEDDVLPEQTPRGLIRELSLGFQSHVAAVSGCYRSRFARELVAWQGTDRATRRFVMRPGAEAYTPITGCGFGCVMARTSALRKAVLVVPEGDWFDPHYWSQLVRIGESLMLANRATCTHVDKVLGDLRVS